MAQFDHIARQVPNVTEAVAWYRTAFADCQVLYQDETWALLDAHGVKLAFVTAGDHPDHVAWRVSSDELETLAATYERPIDPHRDGTRGIYVQDPSGNWVEFIHYPEEA